jgi:hypothetical protein
MQRILARGLWVIPFALLALGVYQWDVSADLRRTLASGEAVQAEVIEFVKNDRPDIPFGYVSLRLRLADGREIVQEKMALPYTLLPLIEHQPTLDVRVLPDAAQPIVIHTIGKTQARIAAVQAGVCFGVLLHAGLALFFWNRMLTTAGDPALRVAVN